MISLVVLICHMIVGITDPICHEEVIAREEQSLKQCQIGNQQVVADWKDKSIYQSDDWHVAVIHCAPGDYQPKDMI